MLVFFRRNGSVQFIHQVKRKQDITIREKSSAVRKYHKFTWPGDSEKTMRSSSQLPPAKQTTQENIRRIMHQITHKTLGKLVYVLVLWSQFKLVKTAIGMS